MKKIFIVHGFEETPNDGWQPWLMAELEKKGVYSCALPMPSPKDPACAAWVKEIARCVERDPKDQIYLVGHSLGVPAILHMLGKTHAKNIKGAVLVSGPIHGSRKKTKHFFDKPFNYRSIKARVKQFLVIHGDNDPQIHPTQATELAQKLNAELVWVKDGKHLNSSAGWYTLPACLEGLCRMMRLT